jgi:uncharacterized protein YndB with AHSA1/START domain
VQHETSFDYTSYVAAPPERIWRALTDPADTRRYWRHREAGGKTFPSDWKRGSRWALVHDDIGLVVSDPAMVILESDPPRQLSYTWHTFTPEWAAAVGLDPGEAAAWRAEPRSKVAFDLEETAQGVTRLTVVHDGFAPGSVVLPNIALGWPAVCSSLKSLVETGTPLP